MDKPVSRGSLRKLLPAVILCAVTLAFAVGSLSAGDRSSAAQSAVWKPLLYMRDSVRLRLGADSIGDIYIADGRLLRRMPAVSEETMQSAAAAVNSFAAETALPVCCAAIPTATDVYSDLLPKNAPYLDEAALLRGFCNQLDDGIVQIDLISQFHSLREEDTYELYLRTDPRWTSFGAFCAYQTVIRKLGFSAVGYDKFAVAHFSSSYYGTLAQEIQFFRVQPDLIDLYTNDAAPAVVSGTAWDGSGNPTELTAYYDVHAEGYNVYRAAEVPVLQMETDLQNGRALLLFCDSYGAPMIPFLMQHYHRITAVNTELAADLDWRSITADSEYTQVLILCSTETIAAEDGFSALQPNGKDT